MSRTARTDGDGSYQFAALQAGKYSVSASKSAYVDLALGQRQPSDRVQSIDVAEGQALDHVDFALPRGAVFTGRVVDEYGEPMPGVQVATTQIQTVNGQKRTMNIGRSTSTNDLGEFRLFGIRPGEYALQATWRSGASTLPDRVGYARAFFPGTPDVAAATKFTVRVNQTVADLVIALSPTTVVKVSGTATDSRGRPATTGSLMLEERGDVMSFGMRASGGLRPDGTFSFTGVEQGEYQLRLMPNSGPNGPAEMALVPITVGSEDVADVRVVSSPPSKIFGRIIIDDAQIPFVPPQLTATPMGGGPVFGSLARAIVANDLTFELPAWPGLVRIAAVTLPPNWTIRAIRAGGVDVIDTGLEIKVGKDVSGVEIEITSRVASASGAVTNARGEPAKDCMVIIFPSDAKRITASSRYIRTMRTDGDGRFRTTGLPPGDYYAVAIERFEPGQSSSDPELLDRLRPSSSTFVIGEGETRTLDLRLISR